jgi:hypothetical protein
LHGTVVPLLSEARHRGAVVRHMTVVGELSTHGTVGGRVVREEADVVDSSHVFFFVCELSVGEGGVLCVGREIRPV